MLESYDIHIIKKITDNGSLSKAAEELCISQSTLSKRVTRLENALGVSLFYRHNIGMTPTKAAEYMIQKGIHIRDQLRSIERHIKMLGNLEGGDLNVGIGPIVEQIFFPELLLKYSAQTANIRVRLTTGTTDQLMTLLTNGDIDVAIGSLVPEAHTEQLPHIALIRDKVVFVARSEHPVFRQPSALRVADLNQYDFIGPDIPPSIRSKLPPEMLDKDPTVSCENYNTIKSLVLRSDYITGGPTVLFQQELDHGRLRIIPGLTEPLWESYLVVKPESMEVPAVAKFIEVVKGCTPSVAAH